MAETHFIKAWPPFFRAIQRGDKRFEVRKDDRAYQTGDTLVIKEFDPATSKYSGAEVRVPVTFCLRGGEFGVEPGVVVMSLGEFLPEPSSRTLDEMLSGARRDIGPIATQANSATHALARAIELLSAKVSPPVPAVGAEGAAPEPPWDATPSLGQNAKREGWRAFYAGRSRDACPFPVDRLDLKHAYQVGWDAAWSRALADYLPNAETIQAPAPREGA